jgi:hypothetical protein
MRLCISTMHKKHYKPITLKLSGTIYSTNMYGLHVLLRNKYREMIR